MALGDSSINSPSINKKGSSIAKTIFLSMVVFVLLLSVALVLGADTEDGDGDGFTNTTNATHPKDCNDNNSIIRPVVNGSPYLVGYKLTICPGTYVNTTLIVNSSSNSSIWIDGNSQGNGTVNFTFHGTNASLRNFILINGTKGGVGIANISVVGYQVNDSTNATNIFARAQNTQTLAINITNSSNINITNFLVRELLFNPAIMFVQGDNVDNVTLQSGGFYNYSDASAIWINATGGNKINITGNNFSILFNTTVRGHINSTLGGIQIQNNSFSIRNDTSETAAIWLNASNNFVSANTFKNTTYGIYLDGSSSNNVSSNVMVGSHAGEQSAGMVMQDSNTNILRSNVFGNVTGIGLVVSASDGNIIANNTVSNNTVINIYVNASSQNNWLQKNTVKFAGLVNGTGILLNNTNGTNISDSVVHNNTFNGIIIQQSWNVTAYGNKITNGSRQGLQMVNVSDMQMHNFSVGGNDSQVAINLTLGTNVSLHIFNVTFTSGDGLQIANSSNLNITLFNIWNTTGDGIEIINSSNVKTRDVSDVNVSNITDVIATGIYVHTNSSNVNLSTIRISNTTNGVRVNGSDNIAFHNLTVANSTLDAVVYDNVTGKQSVLGFCNLSNSASNVDLRVLESTFLTFACDPIDNTNLSSVRLQITTRSGSGVFFNVPLNLSALSLDRAINISERTIFVNQSQLSAGRNISGNISFVGLPFNSDNVVVDYDNDTQGFRGCGDNCTITATGTTIRFNVSHFSTYKVNPTVTQVFATGGGGGGGGRSPGFKFIVPTASGVSVLMNTYDAGRLRHGQGAYNFKVTRTYRDSVDLTVGQKGYKLSLGKSVNVDLDGDNKADVNVALVKVIHNQAEFVVKLGAQAISTIAPTVGEPMAEPVAAEEPAYEAPDEEAPEVAPVVEEAPPAPMPKKKGNGGMVFTLIVVAVVLGLLYIHFKKKKEMV